MATNKRKRCSSPEDCKMMKAIRVAKFGGPKVLQVENISVPTISDEQVLVNVKSAGVNPVDTYIRAGAYSRLPELPYTPGADFAGIVDKVDSKISKFKKGDRVFCHNRESFTGAYAEFCALNVRNCYSLPDDLTFAQGAAIGVPYFTAYRALFQKAHAKPGQSVLVHGASGAVGLAALQIGKAVGLEMYGTAGTPEGLQLVLNNGATAAFNHREEGYLQKFLESRSNEGVNVILEMLSNVNLAHDLEILASRGTVVVIGCRGPVKINPREMMGKESSIVGMALATATQEEVTEMGAFIEASLASGNIKPVVDKEYPLSESQQAHHDVIENKGAKGKLVIDVSK